MTVPRRDDRPAPARPTVRTCLNCDATFAPADRFCGLCGQRTDTARLTFADLVRDLLHTFVNVERGPLAFVWGLLTRPGELARDFVAGRRRRHYGPFATLAVVVGATTLAINAARYDLLAHDGLSAEPESLMQRHFNVVLLVQLPLLGSACALLFRRARLHLTEHMVLAAYTLSVRAGFLALTIPLSLLSRESHAPPPGGVVAYWIAWYVYFGWAASRFYAGTASATWLRGAVAAALTHAAISALMLGADRTYLRFFNA